MEMRQACLNVRNPNQFTTSKPGQIAAFAEVGKLRVLSRDVTVFTVNGSSKL
jgi:hypothetical protein